MAKNKSRSSKKSKRTKTGEPSFSQLNKRAKGESSNSKLEEQSSSTPMDVDETPVASGYVSPSYSKAPSGANTPTQEKPKPKMKIPEGDIMDTMIVPNPSIGLRRLPVTPRYPSLTPHELERRAALLAIEEETTADDDDDDDYYTTDSEEELEEDRTVHALLAPRMRNFERMEKTAKDLLVIMYHTMEGHQRLLNECDLLHKQVIPYNLRCFYRRPDKRVVGVLVDHDMFPQLDSDREKELEEIRSREKSRLTGSTPANSGPKS